MKALRICYWRPTAAGLLLLAALTPAVFGQVLQEWNFTGGSLLSNTGTNAGFFGTIPDNDLNDQYNVTRGNGNSGSVFLGTPVSAANASSLTISITLADFNFSNGNDQFFAARFRSGTTTVADVRWDAQIASPNRMRITGLAVGGIALNSTVSAQPITYGMTLSFVDNTYTYWLGSPSSGAETWVSRFANYTGPLSLGAVTIDNVNWGIDFYAAGNSFNLDQIQVSMTPIPEPSLLTLVALGGLGLLRFRRPRR